MRTAQRIRVRVGTAPFRDRVQALGDQEDIDAAIDETPQEAAAVEEPTGEPTNSTSMSEEPTESSSGVLNFLESTASQVLQAGEKVAIQVGKQALSQAVAPPRSVAPPQTVTPPKSVLPKPAAKPAAAKSKTGLIIGAVAGGLTLLGLGWLVMDSGPKRSAA